MSKRLRNWCFTSYDLESFKVPDDHPDFRYCVYQAEECPETKRVHYQGYIEFNKAVHFNTVKRIFGDDSIHLESRKGTRQQARAYCMKPESRYAEPIEFGKWEENEGKRSDLNEGREKIQSHTSWNSVLNDPELCNTVARHPRWAREVYDAKKLTVEEPEIELYDWEEEVLAMLEEEPVKRRVIWIWSDESGTGKTTFYDYCSFKFDVLPGTDFVNTLYAYDGQRIIWFDLTRAQQADFSPYHAIEKFSNKTVHLSTKYTSTRKLVSCHVVVTANHPPDLNKLPNRCIVIEAKKN